MIVIVGPTGVGKSNLAIHLSQKIDGEIINADSRQIYTDMNIGTAKPNNQELSLVPHHLFSIINPDQDFSVYDFSQMAESAIIDINLKGRVPVLVGGTGQYIWSLLENWEHPTIALTMVVRNEEHCVERWVNSWKDVVDYYVIKNKKVINKDIFSSNKDGSYHYSGGWQIKAIYSLFIGFIFASSTIWNVDLRFLQPFSWIIGAILSSITYYLLASK